MLEAITSGLTTVVGWVGTVVTAFVGESGELKALLPLIGISCAISVVMLGIKVLKGMIWGA